MASGYVEIHRHINKTEKETLKKTFNIEFNKF